MSESVRRRAKRGWKRGYKSGWVNCIFAKSIPRLEMGQEVFVGREQFRLRSAMGNEPRVDKSTRGQGGLVEGKGLANGMNGETVARWSFSGSRCVVR